MSKYERVSKELLIANTMICTIDNVNEWNVAVYHVLHFCFLQLVSVACIDDIIIKIPKRTNPDIVQNL